MSKSGQSIAHFYDALWLDYWNIEKREWLFPKHRLIFGFRRLQKLDLKSEETLHIALLSIKSFIMSLEITWTMQLRSKKEAGFNKEECLKGLIY